MKKKLVSILCLAGLMVGCFTAGVGAASNLQEIKAYLNYGITIEYNDVDQTMYDAGGNRVYPITYNGTTYLPVRAVSNMLGVKVDWDQNTQHVLLGNSYVDTAPAPQTPVVTDDKFDFTFISEAIVAKGNNRVALDKSSAEHITAEGLWLGQSYTVGSDVAYSFPTLNLQSVDSKPSTELKAVEDYICNALVQRGYTLAKTDEFGQKHYVKGDVEFQVWNINGSNTSLSLRAYTKWLGCCIDY